MTQLEKLIARIRARPLEASFGDVSRLLEAYGWRLGRQRGSHVTFEKRGEFPITVSTVKGRMVKTTYLELICERLGLDD